MARGRKRQAKKAAATGSAQEIEPASSSSSSPSGIPQPENVDAEVGHGASDANTVAKKTAEGRQRGPAFRTSQKGRKAPAAPVEVRRSGRIVAQRKGAAVAAAKRGSGAARLRGRGRGRLRAESLATTDEEGDGEEDVAGKRPRRQLGLEDLTPDDFEHLAKFLDTKSALALLATSKGIHRKLVASKGFWRVLCLKEKFHEYTILKTGDKDEEESSEEDSTDEGGWARKKELTRLSWNGEKFHDVRIPKHASSWQKVYRRGLQMRRNICQGRYEMWRLFLTGHDHLPVKKMSEKTTQRELRSSHRKSPFNRPERRVRIHRYWNEDYLVAVQFAPRGHDNLADGAIAAAHGQPDPPGFHDVFVWGWHECQRPSFLYTKDVSQMYPNGVFPTAFFLHRNYLVLMPDPVLSDVSKVSETNGTETSMIRVHDLSNNMNLVGKYDFPEDSPYRRFYRIRHGHSHEAAHLHKIGDVAVALCRVPGLTLFTFSLPDCKLLTETPIASPIINPYDLDQRFLMRDSCMMFMLHDPEFFNQDEDPEDLTRLYGAMLFVDFEDFVAQRKKPKAGDVAAYITDGVPLANTIKVRVDPHFDCNIDYVEKISVLSRFKLVCSLYSGKIVVREMTYHDEVGTTCSSATHNETMVIRPPESVRDLDAGTEESDSHFDGPTLCVSRDGDLVVEMRHFSTGRKLYAYDLRRGGKMRYCIDMDDPALGLQIRRGYVSIDMDGNFLCAADLDRIVVWDSRNGRFIRDLPIVPHYATRRIPEDDYEQWSWKGHTDFAFAEDGIIIIHGERNFPVAADVMLFW